MGKGVHVLNFCVPAKHCIGALIIPTLYCYSAVNCYHILQQADTRRGETSLQVELKDVGCKPRSA